MWLATPEQIKLIDDAIREELEKEYERMKRERPDLFEAEADENANR